ncbi:hypothetical protein ACTQ6A_02880 [Lachnospiraceae bacterium LCP25S3_G4]
MVFGFFLLVGACGGSDSATITQSAMAVYMVSGMSSMVAGGLLARYYIKKECSQRSANLKHSGKYSR